MDKGIEAKRMMEYQKDSLLDWSRGKVVCASSKGAQEGVGAARRCEWKVGQIKKQKNS